MEHTKGEIEEVIECSNAISLLFKDDGSQIAQVMDEDGEDLTDTQRAYATELVRRFNAFEEGGIVEELRTACEKLVKAENHYASSSETLVKFGSKIRSYCVPLAKAALAKI